MGSPVFLLRRGRRFTSVLSRPGYFCLASILPLCRPAALRWISPFRAARSSNWTARFLSAGDAASVLAFLRAVRRVERCARFRTAAARDLRRCLAAEAILGKGCSRTKKWRRIEPRRIGWEWADVKKPQALSSVLTPVRSLLTLRPSVVGGFCRAPALLTPRHPSWLGLSYPPAGGAHPAVLDGRP